MKVALAQVEMNVEDPRAAERERERDAEAQQDLLSRLLRAMREVCREHGYEHCANALDAIWAPLGRGVSSSSLKMTLAPGNERNYVRIEWAIWFAQQSEEVADLVAEMAGRGKPKKKPEDELRDLQAIVRAEMPKQADRIIRKAATP